MKKFMILTLGALLFLASSAGVSLADPLMMDIFDWSGMSNAQKVQSVGKIQQALKSKGILRNTVDNKQLAGKVEALLKIDNEQAIIADKVCNALRLNCESLGYGDYE